MTPEKTTEHPHHRRLPQVSADKPTWMWRIATGVCAAGAGIFTSAALVRDKFYDEMKKTPGFREKRASSLKEYDAIVAKAMEPTNIARDSWTKFKWYISERGKIDKPYTKAFAEDMKSFFGISSGNLWEEAKGIAQRFILLGSNNKINVLIRGALTSAATVSVIMLLRENNRLWGRLDESRQQQAQDRVDMHGLLTQVVENHSKLLNRSSPAGMDEERSEGHPANDNAANDNLTDHAKAKPHHKVHMDSAQHHDRVAHGEHAHHPL